MVRKKTIQGKFKRVILIITAATLLLTCTAYFAYEVYSFRRSSLKHLSILGKMVALNSSAALAFDDKEAAHEILSALNAEPHIVVAGLYDSEGKIFSKYPKNISEKQLPLVATDEHYTFSLEKIQGFQPIVQEGKRLGTLFIKSDTKAIYERLWLYLIIDAVIIFLALLFAFFLSQRLQKRISGPISSLAATAEFISHNHDYSVRATKESEDEMGVLTDAFNQMLLQIERQNREILSFTQSLEQKVDERTKELQAANNELESFSYSVSHDLKSPLRHITTFTELFVQKHGGKLDADGMRLLNKVSANSKKMSQLIDDLLSFSKIGRQEVKKELLNMDEVVRSVCDDVARVDGDHTINLVIHPLPDCFADRITMRQVWENLISNAIKYTRNKREAVVEIGAEQTEVMTIYCIKDNGAGFEMNDYDKLFTAFQRLHSAHEFEGTGLGLAIVERIIEKHGGSIWATGKVDEGATFYFSLPRQSSLQEQSSLRSVSLRP